MHSSCFKQFNSLDLFSCKAARYNFLMPYTYLLHALQRCRQHLTCSLGAPQHFYIGRSNHYEIPTELLSATFAPEVVGRLRPCYSNTTRPLR